MSIAKKIYLYTKDVEALKGCGKSTAIKCIKQVREFYKVPARQQITVEQYANFFGISVDLVLNAIQ